MISRVVCCVLVLFVCVAHAQQEPKPLYVVEQSFDGGNTWTTRGSVQTIGINKRLNYVPTGAWRIPNEITEQKHSLYQIRFVDQENNGVIASISLCDLIKSQFREVLLLHLDQATHKLISVDYSSAVDTSLTSSPFSRSIASCPIPENVKKGIFNQNVKIGIAAPVHGEKISFTGVKSVEEKKKEEDQQNEPGFLRKYVSSKIDDINHTVVPDHSWCAHDFGQYIYRTCWW
jgi:hypothetical protein